MRLSVYLFITNGNSSIVIFFSQQKLSLYKSFCKVNYFFFSSITVASLLIIITHPPTHNNREEGDVIIRSKRQEKKERAEQPASFFNLLATACYLQYRIK